MCICRCGGIINCRCKQVSPGDKNAVSMEIYIYLYVSMQNIFLKIYILFLIFVMLLRSLASYSYI